MPLQGAGNTRNRSQPGKGVYDATQFGKCCYQDSAFHTPDDTSFYNREFRCGERYEYSKGAFHSADLWCWFGTLDACWRPMEEKDYALSGQMAAYLCNFVRSGDPNGEDLPRWRASKQEDPAVMLLGEQETGMGIAKLQKENVPQRKGESE